jgi:hypothetical protein
VKAIAHRILDSAPPLLLEGFLTEERQEVLSVVLITKELLLLVAAGCAVVEGVMICNPQLASQERGS